MPFRSSAATPRLWKQLKFQHTALPAPLQELAAWDPYLTRLASIPLPPDCHLLGSTGQRLPLAASRNRCPPHSTYRHCRSPIRLIQCLYNGHAPGLNGLLSEILRYARPPPLPADGAPQLPDPLLPLPAQVLTAAIQEGFLPQQVSCSLITPVYKRGDTLEPDNYRPIAITEAITCLNAAILQRRILL